jgi:hypothetical protein
MGIPMPLPKSKILILCSEKTTYSIAAKWSDVKAIRLLADGQVHVTLYSDDHSYLCPEVDFRWLCSEWERNI